MSILFIMCGLPGTFKSSTALRIVEDYKAHMQTAFIVSGDSLRTMIHGKYVFKEVDEFAVSLLAKACIASLSQVTDVIIYDEVNLTRESRSEIIDFAYSIGFTPVIHYCVSDGNHIARRCRDDKGYPPHHWENVIRGMERIFEEPTEDEECQLIKTVTSFSPVSTLSPLDMDTNLLG